jgi:hypothetical protein
MTKAQVEVITSVQRRRQWLRAEKERIVAIPFTGDGLYPFWRRSWSSAQKRQPGRPCASLHLKPSFGLGRCAKGPVGKKCMVRPAAAKREAVAHLSSAFDMSERRGVQDYWVRRSRAVHPHAASSAWRSRLRAPLRRVASDSSSPPYLAFQ